VPLIAVSVFAVTPPAMPFAGVCRRVGWLSRTASISFVCGRSIAGDQLINAVQATSIDTCIADGRRRGQCVRSWRRHTQMHKPVFWLL